MSEFTEYLPIVIKLLERTREQKLEWQVQGVDRFECVLNESRQSAFKFSLSAIESRGGPSVFLYMFDSSGHQIFVINSLGLPTNPEEEKLSDTLVDLYRHVRRKALKIDEKLRMAEDLLDKK
jgi:hypothetical protein